MNMKAEIIAVGSELLTPDRVHTDSLFLTEELNKIGSEVVRKTVVGDNREFLRDAFRDALERVPLVISTGGLGPTQDDLTREAVSDVLGRKLRLRDDLVEHIRARFRSFGREMTENNLQQAMVPEGAEPLANSRGTAPGIWIEDSGRMLALLPGPPRELMPMFKEHVLPRLVHRLIRITGLGESLVDQRIAPIYKRHPEVDTTILASQPGEIHVHLRTWTSDESQALKTIDEILRGFELALSDRIFSQDGSSLEEVVAKLLTLHNATIAAAESCTGGLLAQRLTNIAG